MLKRVGNDSDLAQVLVPLILSGKRDRSGAAISDGRVLCQILIFAIVGCAAKSSWVLFLSFFITRCLESLASMDKTGIKYIDKLLAMISMIVYTYGNKHQVQKWWVVLLQISNRYWVNLHVLDNSKWIFFNMIFWLSWLIIFHIYLLFMFLIPICWKTFVKTFIFWKKRIRNRGFPVIFAVTRTFD